MPDTRDSEAQTSPKLSPQVPAYQPPQSAPPAARVQPRPSSDAPTQTDCKETAEAASQMVLDIATSSAQTSSAKAEELGVQAGSGLSKPAHVETQTAAAPAKPELLDMASQANPTGSEAAVQAGYPPPMPAESASQTDPAPAGPARAEVEVQASAAGTDSSMQTEARSVSHASCEAQIEKPKAAKNVLSAASQTSPPARNAATTQTKPASKSAVAVQASATVGTDKSTQAEDDRIDRLEKREAEHLQKIAELEAMVAKLNGEKDGLKADLAKATETAEAYQNMVQAKAFGQMNVTILCPRAECTVSGERIEMDSWNPKRLREEFEREVLPRFTRVFVEETNSAAKASKARSEAVDKAMQDFAETFRERLSAMLSAPNAAAAVQAAANAKTGSR